MHVSWSSYSATGKRTHSYMYSPAVHATQHQQTSNQKRTVRDTYLDFHWSLTRRSLWSFRQGKVHIVQHSTRPTKINSKRKQVNTPNKQATIRTFSISISCLPCLPLSTLQMSCPCARMACIYCGGLQHRERVNRHICYSVGLISITRWLGVLIRGFHLIT